MSSQSEESRISRRRALTGIGLGGVAVAQLASPSQAQGAGLTSSRQRFRYLTVNALKAASEPRPGDWVETLGFYVPGDGGAAVYQVQEASQQLRGNDGDILALENGSLAVLKVSHSLNYRMFGTRSDGEADDGVQIKLAHEYANRHQLAVVNLVGEFWIKQTVGIPITTPVQWGKTVFHVDERFNDRRTPRFVVRNDRPSLDLIREEKLCRALVQKLKPGVQIIPELAPYAGHLVVVQDADDRIGVRAGYAGNKGWAREELFYVEEEGRILGDIAWAFQHLTAVTATPCNNNYLVIQGGGFHFSGDTPEGGARGYHQHGIGIQRSRTIIRDQWMGLEPGKRDVSREPRSGFYVLNGVYDVTLENIRAMPWEKARRPPEPAVEHGTYGIGGARMLNCTFRNLTAEGGPVAWGVFGTNLNKNFRLECCRLNRIDVHFHCWNLHIHHCAIGFKGISITGGGELFVNETTVDGNSFVNFRPDYGARWDGPIRLRGCTLRPHSDGTVSVLRMRPGDFNYQYPVGFGTSVAIEDCRIDYSAAPTSTSPCWLMDIAPFSQNQHGQRLFFPRWLLFRNIVVIGREQGVRLLRIPNPYQYDLRRAGGCDESRLRPNCTLICDHVQLEQATHDRPGAPDKVHLLIGRDEAVEYADQRALYPKIVFVDCEDVSVCFVRCAASVFLDRCSVNAVTACELSGELSFTECRFQPVVRQADGPFYAVESSLGTRFTNCTVHAPIVQGKVSPDLIDRIGFLEINKPLQHAHLNTALGAEVMKHLRDREIVLDPGFIAQMRCTHALDK